METGFVFNIQKYSIHDGPGIRTMVFLKGCPLHCGWCHNPEGQAPDREISLSKERCIRCGSCMDVCLQTNCSFLDTLPHIDRSRCIRCGRCVEVCPTGAREMIGIEMTVGQVMAEVLQDRIFYDDSGGGVTLSGGEPLMQPRFTEQLLMACRTEGIHTAVDTCGYAPEDVLFALAPLTDLFLYDIKLMDDSRHRSLTGVSNRLILRNLTNLSGVHENIWIRIPVIPGVNDTTTAARSIADFITGMDTIRRVVLLPYHDLATHKAERLGHQFNPPTTNGSLPMDCLESLAGPFQALGLSVRIGGSYDE